MTLRTLLHLTNRVAIGVAGLLGVAGAAFAQMPAQPQGDDCDRVAAEFTQATEVRRVAQEKSDTAWKAVVPFAVLARKASGKSAVAEADKRLAELKPQAARCGLAEAR